MRTIKFRARWKDTGKVISDFMEEYIIESLNDSMFIVEQFTGLKDKNRKEIYEGDIVRDKSEYNTEDYLVCFGDYSNGLDYEDNDSGYGYYLREITPRSRKLKKDDKVSSIFWGVNNLEVIGNIYENPELLEEK